MLLTCIVHVYYNGYVYSNWYYNYYSDNLQIKLIGQVIELIFFKMFDCMSINTNYNSRPELFTMFWKKNWTKVF